MAIRTVKQHSDRGKIKDLARQFDVVASNTDPSPEELRLKKLFEFARSNNDQTLQSALGFITTDYVSDKNALPLTAYRIRQVIADIKSKSSGTIDQLSQELSQFFGIEQTPEAKLYWEHKNSQATVKTAARKTPVFWRASK